MATATINIEPLIDALGGSSATGATGEVVAVAMAGGVPATRINGAEVILHSEVTVAFTDGVLEDNLVLEVLPENYYWKLTITAGEASKTYYVIIPDSGTYDFDELTFVDITSVPAVAFEPVPGPQGPQGPQGPAFEPLEEDYAVEGGTTGDQPIFTGDPLFAGSYVQTGDLVYFRINVEFDNITSFGTGQYYLTLPFSSKYGVSFRDGCLHDVNTGQEFHISGHTEPGSNVVTLWTTDVQGNTVRDYAFTSSEPVNLTTADSFHIAGSFIIDQEGV